jgi:hypothetical protein
VTNGDFYIPQPPALAAHSIEHQSLAQGIGRPLAKYVLHNCRSITVAKALAVNMLKLDKCRSWIAVEFSALSSQLELGFI